MNWLGGEPGSTGPLWQSTVLVAAAGDDDGMVAVGGTMLLAKRRPCFTHTHQCGLHGHTVAQDWQAA